MHAMVADYFEELLVNSIEAQSTKVSVKIVESLNRIKIRVCDNGCGFGSFKLGESPWNSTKNHESNRKTGLGLSFLKAHLDLVDGSLSFRKRLRGLQVIIDFPMSHIDSPICGDIETSFLYLATSDKLTDVKIVYVKNKVKKQYSKKSLERKFGSLKNPKAFIESKQFLVKMEEVYG